MKTLVLAGAASLLLLAGCAPVPYTKADVDGRLVCNTDYMDQVERQARRNFGVIMWINCPKATLRVI